ncbi:hypothetical protein D1007_35874 [Hordeum vulgare]|nr:hypothetical protein D1007_35874 [Hordeum vulgare]
MFEEDLNGVALDALRDIFEDGGKFVCVELEQSLFMFELLLHQQSVNLYREKEQGVGCRINFVEGARGTNYRQRGGGGVSTSGRNNSIPKWKEVTPTTTDVAAATTASSTLPAEAIAPKLTAEDRDMARANKAARKKEKLTCYRCGVFGHFIVDCTTELTRLLSETYQWAPARVDEQTYRMEFPRRDDLQRLLTFGVSKGTRLEKVWIRFSGIPEILLNDFLIVWSLGSLIGKTELVGMTFTRKRGIARLLVTVLDVEHVPDFAPWSYDGVHYDLDVKVEEVIQPQSQDGDVHMAGGDDRDRDPGDANQDEHSERPKEDRNPSSSTVNDKPPNSGATPTTTPMATLLFGSFEVILTPSRPWGELDVNEGFEQPLVEVGSHDEPAIGYGLESPPSLATRSSMLARRDDVHSLVCVDQLGGQEVRQPDLQVASACRGTTATPMGSGQVSHHTGSPMMLVGSESQDLIPYSLQHTATMGPQVIG